MNILEETKFLIDKYNVSANKKLGQNFLIDENIVNEIIESSNINKEDLIIEIGPGLGTLTSKLLDVSKKVIAIELDRYMVEILEDRFKLYSNFELINNDFLKVNIKEIIEKENIKGKVKVVANLPYYISTPIIMKLLEEDLDIDEIIIMVQKEVGERITANTGSKASGSITYIVEYYAEKEILIKVPSSSFIPSPKVDSEVIKLKIRKNPKVNVKNKDLLFKMIKQSFTQRRKTLVNGLGNLGLSKEEISNILETLGFDKNIRGEVLTLEEFAKISDGFEEKL